MIRLLLTLALLLSPLLARADTPVVMTQSFAGNLNFTGTQKTMRTKSNQSNPCAVVKNTSDVSAVLSGIPAGATVISAQLYWAGSGYSNDSTIYMDDVAVTAPATRRYSAQSGSYYYFGGAADVTAAVQAKGNGTYRFRGLTIDNSNTYCDVEGIVGGFQLLVIYSHPNETFRVLNLYEGFQDFQYAGLTLNLTNFRTPASLGSATARLGHITWEGDATLVANGEDLLFNSTEMVDALNPAHNQFNSASNINNDSQSYGIDFDAYSVGSPTISGNQTSATTRYQTGQDLVILAAEVIAVPNVPVSDFAMTMTAATTSPSLGQVNTFTLVATNNGPNDESGTVTVTDTLPSTMTVTGASGNGWSCSIVSRTVTCTRPGPVSASTVLPAITISVIQSGVISGTTTNTATVAGSNFDNQAGNNSASVNLTMSSSAYAFTTSACVNGKPFGDAAQTCQLKSFGTIAAGDLLTGIYVTALTNNVPTALSSSQTTRTMYFRLRCNNPTTSAGVAPTMTPLNGTAITLPVCTSRDAAVAINATGQVTLTFNASQPSASPPYTFRYLDVGSVNLSMFDASGATMATTGLMVVRPAYIGFTEIKRADGQLNPAAYPLPVPVAPQTYVSQTPAFLRAGADSFDVTVAALASDKASITPNFGREDSPDSFMVKLPLPAKTDITTGADFRAEMGYPTNLADVDRWPSLGGQWQALANGAAKGTGFRWNGVGILELSATNALGNYLGTEPVPSLPANVGRFVPARFVTTIAPAANATPFTCTALVACTAVVPNITGVVYGGQPFNVTIEAQLYQGAGVTATKRALGFTGRFAEDVTLAPYSQLGAGVLVPGTLTSTSSSSNFVAASLFAAATGSNAGIVTTPLKYVFAAQAGNATPAPQDFFVRASHAWTSVNNTNLLATSATRTDSPSEYSALESGLRAVSGRIAVQGNVGPERLPMPVRFSAQFYAGATGGWTVADFDSATTVAPASDVAYASCQKALVCPNPLTLTATTPIVLQQGRGLFVVGAPNRVGSTSAQINVPWLAPAPGTLVFGIRKSPVIYIREAY